jgi:hypothetical protein
MKLTNGINKQIPFRAHEIKKEASLEGKTSLVEAFCDDGTTVRFSQHDSGDWDISVDDDPIDESFTEEEGDEAVSCFIRLCQEHNQRK